MASWKITYHLKNGKELEGIWHGPEGSSDAVVRKLLQGDLNTFNGVRGKDDKSNLFVRNECVDAIDIRPM
jgi:hypothetical protein